MLCANANKKLESTEFTYLFIPRTNVVQVDTTVSIDKYLLILTPELRQELASAMEEYLGLYEGKNLPERSPTKKNAFTTGKVEIYWGVMGYSYTSDASFYTNYEYVEKDKPFCTLTIVASQAKGSDAYSPTARFYMTPTQIRKQFELLDQETLKTDARGKEQELYMFE